MKRQLTQSTLSEVTHGVVRYELYQNITQLPMVEQQRITHRLNSYSVARNTPAYTAHPLSQNAFGLNKLEPATFSAFLALRLGLAMGSGSTECPMLKCKKQSDKMGYHATKCLSGTGPAMQWMHVKATNMARHDALVKTGMAVANLAGILHTIEGSLTTSEKRDGDLVLGPIEAEGFTGFTFIDFTAVSAHRKEWLRLVDTDRPYYLRPVRLTAEAHVLTETAEKQKLEQGGALARLEEANTLAKSAQLAHYVPFAANHYGLIGLGATKLIGAIVARMQASQGKSKTATMPLKAARIKGFFSTAVQRATVEAIIARVANPQTQRSKDRDTLLRNTMTEFPVLVPTPARAHA
jgi:hypothetical protein